MDGREGYFYAQKIRLLQGFVHIQDNLTEPVGRDIAGKDRTESGDREARRKRPPLCTKNFEKNKSIFVHIQNKTADRRGGQCRRRKQK